MNNEYRSDSNGAPRQAIRLFCDATLGAIVTIRLEVEKEPHHVLQVRDRLAIMMMTTIGKVQYADDDDCWHDEAVK